MNANYRITAEQLLNEPFVRNYKPKYEDSLPQTPIAADDKNKSPRHQRVVLIKEEYETIENQKQTSIGNSPKFIQQPSKVDDVKIAKIDIEEVAKKRNAE